MVLWQVLCIPVLAQTFDRSAVSDKALKHFNDAIQAGDIGQQIKAYTLAVETDTAFAEAYYKRGLLYLKVENWELARQDFARLVRFALEPATLGGCYYYLAMCYQNLGDVENAYTSMTQGKRLRGATTKGAYKLITETNAQMARKLDPLTAGKPYLDSAVVYAEAWYRSYKYPRSVRNKLEELYRLDATRYRQKLAHAIFDRCKAIRDRNSEAFIDCMREAFQCDPQHIFAGEELAEALKRSGRFEEAVDTYVAYYEANQHEERYLEYAADILYWELKKPDAALEMYTRILQIDGVDSADYIQNRGHVYYHEGQWEQAVNDYLFALSRVTVFWHPKWLIDASFALHKSDDRAITGVLRQMETHADTYYDWLIIAYGYLRLDNAGELAEHALKEAERELSYRRDREVTLLQLCLLMQWQIRHGNKTESDKLADQALSLCVTEDPELVSRASDIMKTLGNEKMASRLQSCKP